MLGESIGRGAMRIINAMVRGLASAEQVVRGVHQRDFWADAARLREQTRDRQHTDSADLIREDRDQHAARAE